jgi:hypothetical protein
MGSGEFIYRITEGDEVSYTDDETFVKTVIAIAAGWAEGEGPPLEVEYAYHKGWEPYDGP